MGFAKLTHLSFGNIVVVTGLIIVVIDFVLKEKIGFGTLLNAVLIGKFVDLIQLTEIIPLITNIWIGIPVLLLGQFIICFGSYFYIGASLGCGPRDALMVALGKRMPKLPIGAIRGFLEGSVLIIGWLLGAKVGIGTVISVFGIGFALQFTFKLLRFDVKGVEHESIADTARILNKR